MRFFLFKVFFTVKITTKTNYIFTRNEHFFFIKIQLKLEIANSPAIKYIFIAFFMHFVTCFSRKQLHFELHGVIPTV